MRSATSLLRQLGAREEKCHVLAPASHEVLLVVGTGALSRYFVEGHLAVRKYKSVLIWGRDPSKAAPLGFGRKLQAGHARS
jgi:alanine dehydrogenase